MAPTLIDVAVTPGLFPPGGAVPAVVGAVVLAPVVVVLELLDDEQPASTTAMTTASAPGQTQLPRCSPMATLSLSRFSVLSQPNRDVELRQTSCLFL
jgi:hypothetical protein